MGELLASPRIDVAPEVAARVAAEVYGVGGDVSPLPGERDVNVRLDGSRGPMCLKIAHPLEPPEVVDMQAAVLLHLEGVDPGLPVPRLIRTRRGACVGRVHLGGVDRSLLLVTYLAGVAPELGDSASRTSIGVALGRLDRALAEFVHAALDRPLLWDMRQLRELRPRLVHAAAGRRRLLETWLDRFEQDIEPVLGRLRSQAVHGDLNPANVLVDADRHGRVTGIVDFGDTLRAPLVLDPAVAAAYQCFRVKDPWAALDEFVEAYESVNPLAHEERHLLPDLVACRLVQSVIVGAWRATVDPANADYVLADQDDCWATLEQFEARRARPSPSLSRAVDRRRGVLGPALSLSYDDPVRPVRGDGVWLVEADGTRYLDAYNNVPQVGHSRPEVGDAVARQLRELTINTRYLVDAVVGYAERLVALMPDPLDVVMFVNSGSEANDLAYQIAAVVTGNRGAVFTEHAYHGCTWLTTAMSPEEFGLERLEEWGQTIPAPHPLRWQGDAAAEGLTQALDRLASRGHAPAMFVTDTVFASDGIFAPPAGYLRDVYGRIRDAGGLCVADEVQAGFARVGEPFWGFALDGAVPDVVTLGKPMGNGYPMGAVVTTRPIAEEFARNWHFFSTFAGSPVAAAAGSAVLDVIEREELAGHAAHAGARLRRRIAALEHPAVVDVRGVGLFVGVELAGAEVARAVVEGLRRRKVLIGRTGKEKNVLKIRPPLVFGDEHAEILVDALAASLEEDVEREP